jgi:hypothetical protein
VDLAINPRDHGLVTKLAIAGSGVRGTYEVGARSLGRSRSRRHIGD